MTDNPGQAAPGWYPDPSGAPRQRYFDGTNWTENYHDAATAGSPAMAGGAQPAMSPIDYFKKVFLENYANFSGRARRAEYWWSGLVVFGIYVVLVILASISSIFGLLILIFWLAAIVPSIAVGVRRMHDVGKSGWFILIPIYSLILALTDSDRGPNKYGPSEKY